MADRLATLARLRKLQTDLARADLAACLQREAAAAAALSDARAAPSREAGHLDASQPLMLAGAFAGWLPAAAAAIGQREQAAAEAAGDCAHARADLAGRKAAQEAIATLQAERAAQARILRERGRQLALDELGHRRPAG